MGLKFLLVHYHSLRKRGKPESLGKGGKKARKKKLGNEKGRENKGVRITGGEKGQGRGERRRGRAGQKSTLFGLDFVLKPHPI